MIPHHTFISKKIEILNILNDPKENTNQSHQPINLINMPFNLDFLFSMLSVASAANNIYSADPVDPTDADCDLSDDECIVSLNRREKLGKTRFIASRQTSRLSKRLQRTQRAIRRKDKIGAFKRVVCEIKNREKSDRYVTQPVEGVGQFSDQLIVLHEERLESEYDYPQYEQDSYSSCKPHVLDDSGTWQPIESPERTVEPEFHMFALPDFSKVLLPIPRMMLLSNTMTALRPFIEAIHPTFTGSMSDLGASLQRVVTYHFDKSYPATVVMRSTGPSRVRLYTPDELVAMYQHLVGISSPLLWL
jgi:hypothetical protein